VPAFAGVVGEALTEVAGGRRDHGNAGGQPGRDEESRAAALKTADRIVQLDLQMNPDAEITVEARVGHERHVEEDGIDETARLFDPCRRERGLFLHGGMLSMVRSGFAQEAPMWRAKSAY
jgi:hypothetical protein